MKRNDKFYFFISNVLFSSLLLMSSTNEKKLKNPVPLKKSNEEINLSNYEYPKKYDKNRDEVTIAILGTNDIHGQALEKNEIPFGSEKVLVGGFKLLSGVIDKLRNEFDENFLWLDAGDQFTGTYENEITNGSLMIDFFNIMKVNAVAIGNHEWDKKEDQLRHWMNHELGQFYTNNITKWSEELGKAGKNLYLDANLNLKNPNKDQLPNQISTRIFEFEGGKIKIGIIGLITKETSAKTSGFNNQDFEILDYKNVVETEAKKLREKGVKAVIILSHVGMRCKDNYLDEEAINEFYSFQLRDKTSTAKPYCRGELMKLLGEIDRNLIDGIVSGHVHESVHHFYDHIPVIQNPINNIFTNVMYLKFKKNENGEFFLQRDSSLIEGPIPLCSKVYSNTKRCNTFQELKDGLKFVDFTFHGSKIIPNQTVVDLFENKYKNITNTIAELKKDIVAKTEIPLERINEMENILGNMVADIIRNVTKADVSVISPGSLRYFWDRGYINEYSLFNMFPFGGNFGSYKVKGKDLKEIVQKLQAEGSYGFIYSFSGLKMDIEEINHKFTLKSLVMDDGKPIEDDKYYNFASSIFILKGGDDMSKFKHEDKFVNMTISKGPIENQFNIIEAVRNALKNLGTISIDKGNSFLGRIKITRKSVR